VPWGCFGTPGRKRWFSFGRSLKGRASRATHRVRQAWMGNFRWPARGSTGCLCRSCLSTLARWCWWTAGRGDAGCGSRGSGSSGVRREVSTAHADRATLCVCLRVLAGLLQGVLALVRIFRVPAVLLVLGRTGLNTGAVCCPGSNRAVRVPRAALQVVSTSPTHGTPTLPSASGSTPPRNASSSSC